ncbi:helicase-related protein [Polyangium jinanense]|uniref:Helicase n=1 Tax=Polyangium jinanense TaxID=2829994 RepID=A0A9X4AXA9_9BACT|nr:helicase-related protein [Polyangium jinanense]MDC3957408.1 helicase [Polyangium jinanense]MDC3988204.1 helicase [Polyangium jinanense]
MIGSAVTAVLGPTNTGKTHRAVERMLEHESGMIGLPLRLLAREVYDRITARLGEERVALVTGEEKRIPRRPQYWVCTVEAMPRNLEVEFVAVDEIQLASHPQRGHVFTERLLDARGTKETWFMGAASMQPIIAELLPAARIQSFPRLSRLAFAGAEKLARLPQRSAIVAFSMQEVYEVAERLRATRGGAAVVLGALSPRTRNAQVAMFQSGEVEYIVATDAIGMGLNLDVKHVAFAALRKFDGRDVRDLEAAEIGQIAGRAGRYTSDGSFGTLAPLTLPQGLANAVEAHRFPAVRRLVWRNADLDTGSIDGLLASLKRSPGRRSLVLQESAEDAAALARLAQDPAIRARAQGPEAVELLWEVCRIPDYRKLLFESHVALLAEIFAHLAGPRAWIDETWMDERVREIDDPAGDIDTLIARISAIRTWTYVSHQGRWVKDPAAWQERTAAIEDRLSDALHERLVQRFVEKSGGGNKARAVQSPTRKAAPTRAELRAMDKANPFGKLAALKAPQAREAGGASTDEARWVESVVAARHAAIAVDESGRVTFEDGRELGRLVRGSSLLLPDVKLAALPELGAGARARITRRLVAFARDLVEELCAPLRAHAPRGLGAAARGILYQLEQGLGTARAEDAAAQIAELALEDRDKLAAAGIVVGARVLYVPAMLKGPALSRRSALVCAFAGAKAPRAPGPSVVSMPITRLAEMSLHTAVGYPVFGPRAVRADVVEKVFAAIEADGGLPPAGKLAGWLGCPAKEAAKVGAAILGEARGEAESPEPDRAAKA